MSTFNLVETLSGVPGGFIPTTGYIVPDVLIVMQGLAPVIEGFCVYYGYQYYKELRQNCGVNVESFAAAVDDGIRHFQGVGFRLVDAAQTTVNQVVTEVTGAKPSHTEIDVPEVEVINEESAEVPQTTRSVDSDVIPPAPASPVQQPVEAAS